MADLLGGEIDERRKRGQLTIDKAKVIQTMFENGHSTTTIATAVRTIQKFVKEHISDIEGDNWLPFDPIATTKADAKSEQRKNAILDLLNNDCQLTFSMLVERLHESLRCSKSTISKLLSTVGMSRKRLRQIPYERNYCKHRLSQKVRKLCLA